MSGWGVGRFDVGLLGAMLAATAGLLFGSTTTFLLAVVALVYVAFGRASRSPEASVAVERTVGDTSPRPGQEVAVSLAVANVGPAPLPDVRVSDGVPDSLTVVDGSPGLCTGLRPDEEVTVTYTVRAERGTATFGDPAVVVRGAGGGAGERVDVSETTRLSCRTLVSEVGLAPVTLPYTGQVEDDAAGEGIEFHSTRAYQHGDPLSRIDWNRYAATDELTTIDFRETRAAVVLVLVDAGGATTASASADAPTALDLGQYAARKLADALLDDHNRVGVARYAASCRYLPPGAGHDQTVRVERFFGARDRGDDSDGDDGAGTKRGREWILDGDVLAQLRKRTPAETQVLFCSPFLDDRAVRVTEQFAAYGNPVTVVSPDVTTGSTVGGTIERVARDRRLRTVRHEGVRIVDWSPSQPLDAALDRAIHGWSR